MTPLAQTRSILSDLVAFPTVSSDSNLEMIVHIAAMLGELGAHVDLFHDESGHKANLFATLGPREAGGGIVLSGHTDVVPVTDQDWSSNPFEMVEKDGRLFGRGTCDMKGFIACTLAMAPGFAALDLKRPLHFAFTHDEEVGCLGGQALVRELAARGIRPEVAIIGEPTEMRIVEAHKGCCEYTVEFHGLEGHGSNPEAGVNAAEAAVRYVTRLMELAEALKGRTPHNSPFTPPWTTINLGRIAGGHAHNVIPGRAEVEWEMRPVQQSDIGFVKDAMARHVEDVLLPGMRAVDPGASILTEVIGEVVGLEPMDDSAARRLLADLTGQVRAETVPFSTEAGLFQSIGCAAAVCGPGSIAQAHKPDEYVSLDQLSQCLDMLEGLSGVLTAA
ncbi:acetylornithine deacetylase [Rhodovulum marinum]|uniref:Acetylornithine deacetylase n=1 Tax=Rhodovulum marinum TaxID=320662 RepID=A0A4R2Q398_9RHOB|nr:acetylornithine deacetylase [Rhodovulum marinum]TCP43027.1 acetylornithine deacetylase [Rhodovulum marinum]